MAENTENETPQFGDDGWGLRAYAALNIECQVKRSGVTQ